MDQKFRQLIELGAGEFEHADPLLLEYLERTRCTLKSWTAPEVLQNAALYHLAYNVNAIENKMFDPVRRQEVALILGSETENIIYHYCACDREPFFAQLSQDPLFYDKYTATRYKIDETLLKHLCELTAAIEIDKVIRHQQMTQQDSERAKTLFGQLQGMLSVLAQRKVNQIFRHL